VGHVILDPRTYELRELVVQRGKLFYSDRIVDRYFIDLVDRDGTVVLRMWSEDARDLPVYIGDEDDFTSSDAAAAMWIALGSTIVASDGRQVGIVEDVHLRVDGSVHGIVGGFGTFHRHRVEIPSAWIAAISDQRVRLNVPASRVTDE
jgi:hypothetical protein